MKHLILCFVLLSSLTGFAQEKKKTVAVIEFASSGDVPKKEIITLTKRFRDMLVQTNGFQVLERDKMQAILKEQDFIISDDCNSEECAVQVGQLLGVEEMITGDIGKVGDTWTIGLRLINMSTGKIEKTETVDYQGKIDGMLEIMRQTAFIFAGKKLPKGKSVVVFKDNNEPPAQGRIKLDLHYGSGIGAVLDNKWRKAHEYDGSNLKVLPGGGASIGYMVTPRLKTGLEFEYIRLDYTDTISPPSGSSGFDTFRSTPTFTSFGINLSYHFSTSILKPFVQTGIGFQSFKHNMKVVPPYPNVKTIEDIKDLHNSSGMYASVSLGADLSLSRYVDFQIAARMQWAKPFTPLQVQTGFLISAGKSLQEKTE
jgi:hypothetical protein